MPPLFAPLQLPTFSESSSQTTTRHANHQVNVCDFFLVGRHRVTVNSLLLRLPGLMSWFRVLW